MNRKQIGDQGESVAEEFLIGRGYEVVCRNYRCRRGEIDLICRKDNVLVFVEVRSVTNTPHADASVSITYKKKRRLVATALHFLRHNSQMKIDGARFDVVAVNFGLRRLRHIPSAFMADSV